MQSRICKQERQSQVNPPCIEALLQLQERVEYRLGGRLVVEIHKYSTKSTSTYYEAKNTSQFFWLAEWFVQSANMVDSSVRYPYGTNPDKEKQSPPGRTHEVRMGQQQYDSCTSAQLYVRVQ